MPIKKNGSGKRWVEMELIVPGSPEEVWQAIATGSGNNAWFTKTEIDERVGGKIAFDFGPNGSSTGEVTHWEPPARFAYVEREWSEGAPPVATEITVTARSGDRCVLRMVHSLFTANDDWDDQLEGFEGGWPAFFEILKIYLAHFAGEKAVSSFAMVSTGEPQARVWERLTEALGLLGANVGEERSTPPRPERLAGIVERVQQDTKQRYLLLRLKEPGAGIALIGSYSTGEGTNASIALYHYGDGAKARAKDSEPKWQEWMATTFN